MPLSFNAYELQAYQPNRYPFLLIDMVTECEPGQYARGYKNLTNNEWYFPIHFKENPNMPGCLQIEAMAQMLTVAITSLEHLKGEIVHGYKHIATFHEEIKPGYRLDLDAKVLSFKRGLCRGYVRGSVGEKLACELETTLLVPRIFNQFKPGGKQ